MMEKKRIKRICEEKSKHNFVAAKKHETAEIISFVVHIVKTCFCFLMEEKNI